MSTEVWSLKQHMREKPMWIGSKLKSEDQVYTIVDGKIISKKVFVVPALEKCIDEILVNASDQCTRLAGVTFINVAFDRASKKITIANDGKGIPVYPAAMIKGADGSITSIQQIPDEYDLKQIPKEAYKWNPQIICEHPLSGTNLSKRDIHITGGVNGAGMKLVNYNSQWFSLYTYDQSRNLEYYQEFTQGSDHIGEPAIKKTITPTARMTIVSFILDFPNLGYPTLTDYDLDVIDRYIQIRCYHLAAYCKVAVVYQGQQIAIRSAFDISKMAVHHQDGKAKTVDVTFETKNPIFRWDVSVGPSTDNKFEFMSIINGIDVSDGGTHVSYLTDQIVDYCSKKMASSTKGVIDGTKLKNRILSNIFIIICGAINNPQFLSQTKTKIKNPSHEFTEYRFTDKQLDKMYDLLLPYIESSIFELTADLKKTKKVNRKKVDVKACVEAKYAADAKFSKHCRLFIPEGESAKGMIERILTSVEFISTFTYDYYGWFNINGVPMNARRQVTKRKDPRTGIQHMIRSAKLRDNKRLAELNMVLGLDFAKDYTTQEDINTLRYGGIIITTDQDEDGKGNICSLILSYFAVFWPELLKRGYVQRLNTPIIRVSNKKTNDIINFYSQASYRVWKNSIKAATESELKIDLGGGVIRDPEQPDESDDPLKDDDIDDRWFNKRYSVEYYKGLAKNSPEDEINIFKNYAKNLVTYTYDEQSEEWFEIYLGKDADRRKLVLKEPNKDELPEITNIPCSYHLNYDTKDFQRYNISRKLPNVMDGLITSRRKALATAFKYFAHSNKQLKVATFVGKVMSEMGYHHGNGPMEDCVAFMGREYFPTNFPLFIGSSISNFGSRKCNGKDAGDGRYIDVKLNKKLTDILFPVEDNQLLEYEIEEGVRYEPKYYVPIVPLVLLESITLPAHGWQISTWARDFNSVLELTRYAIKSDPTTLSIPKNCLPISSHRWKGRFTEYDGKLYSVGTYILDEKSNTVYITELPLGVSSNSLAYGTDKEAKKKKKFEESKKSSTSLSEKFAKASKATKTKPAFTTEQLSKMFNPASASTAPTPVIHGNELLELEKSINVRDDDGEFNSVVLKYKKWVDGLEVSDRSNDDQVNIIVPLEPGAIQKIREQYKHPAFDPFIEFFKLRTAIHSNINLIGSKGEILELSSYEDAFQIWFNERKRLYQERYQRRIIILQLQIFMLKQICKYVEMRKDLGLDNTKLSVVESDKIIESAGLVRLKCEVINRPGFIPNDKLVYYAMQSGDQTYDYLHQLNGYQVRTEYQLKRAKRIADLESELEERMKPQQYFLGASEWLAELNDLERLVANVRSNKKGWTFDEKPKKYKN